MRVLLLSHTYVVALNRQKIAALAQQPDLEITLVIPDRWDESLREGRADVSDPAEPWRTVCLPTKTSGDLWRHSYSFRQLWSVFKNVRPHVTQIEEELGSIALLQAVLCARTTGSRVIFFTWENLLRQFGAQDDQSVFALFFSGHPRVALAKCQFRVCEILALRLAHGAIAGNYQAEQVLRQKGFVPKSWRLPQLGVDAEFFTPAPRLSPANSNNERFTIGFIGRLTPEKGIHTLLAAWGRLPDDATMLVIGRGILEDKLQQQIAQPGRVCLVPGVEHHQVPTYLHKMDVLVLPSQTTPGWKEQFGHVLIEAMACEVPVVGSDSGAIPDVIGDAGFIFREGDVGDLTDKLTILYRDHSLRQELGRRGRERVLAHFTHARIAAETRRIYEELLSTQAQK